MLNSSQALNKEDTATMRFIFLLTVMCVLTPIFQTHLPNATISDLSLRNMDFAMNLYRKISSIHDKNIFFSPLSVSNSFAALLLASGGATHDEILNGLNLHDFDEPELLPKLFQVLNENITQNGSLKMDQGMAVFLQSRYQVEKRFLEQIKEFFGAEIKNVDFGDTANTIDFINAYIRQKTRDKIQDVVSTVNPMTRLMLINTIFFQGAWQMPFNPNVTSNAPFYIDNYSVVQVPMMFLEDKFYMMQDDQLGAKVLKLPYQEGFSMLILLPNKNVDYTTIDDEINASRFLSWIRQLEKIKLEVVIPKFKIEQSYALHSLLPDMGMASVFSNTANLTKLSTDEGLMVSEVLHKAVIEVDEIGTTAAAATTTGITPYSLPRIFLVNRPFFFFIYHEDTNCILFMGRVIDPTEN